MTRHCTGYGLFNEKNNLYGNTAQLYSVNRDNLIREEQIDPFRVMSCRETTEITMTLKWNLVKRWYDSCGSNNKPSSCAFHIVFCLLPFIVVVFVVIVAATDVISFPTLFFVRFPRSFINYLQLSTTPMPPG